MAETDLLYPNCVCRNSGLRPPEETDRTINLLLAELAKVQKRADDLEQALGRLRGRNRDLEQKLGLVVEAVARLTTGGLN